MSSSIGYPRIALVVALLAAAAAQGCHQNLVRRQRTDWQSEAKISDPNAECTPYSYPPVQAMVKSYPAIWAIANLSQPGIDPMAIELYHKISPNIPNIKVKGTPNGDFTAFTPTYPHTDPDCWFSFGNCSTPKLAGLPTDISSCPEPNTWGLTIDDGPNCSHNAYYDYLRQSNQKATLFYIGSNVIDWPLEAQRGLADGHEICLHTWSHSYMTGLTNEQVFAELYFTKKIIKDVVGVTVLCWRPPFGDVDDRVRYIAKALGLSTILWDNDMNDFRYLTLGQAAVDANYQRMLDSANKGGFNTKGTIVLTHELNADTMATSQKFLPKIGQAFKYITPVAVCQNNTHPYVESTYSYPTFAQWAAGTRTGNLPPPVSAPNEAFALPNTTASNSTTPTNPYTSSNATTSNSTTQNAPATTTGVASPTSDAPRRAFGFVLSSSMLVFCSMIHI